MSAQIYILTSLILMVVFISPPLAHILERKFSYKSMLNEEME